MIKLIILTSGILLILYSIYYYKIIKNNTNVQIQNNKSQHTLQNDNISNQTNQINNNLEENTKNNIFFDIKINDKNMGMIIFKLYDDIVPKTTNNFRQLSIHKKYKNTNFHRVIKDFMIQGGDFTKGDGTGGLSIYGDNFDDENFTIKHTKPGLLSMANAGPNTNGSQFFITTQPTPHLDNKHVVFGEVISGMDIIHNIENIQTNDDKPIYSCTISDCGSI